ncbi:hypothetical protein JHL18_06245 [Clostridium sp. YIM B02505]|uniref:Uncharacterized protein n=1 Tax=Clostridium yunnanense TaxID=2800325 RepID=A0ABS1ELJ1_9CLOT|nr:hypothetical protein [Clostridium yunnanense]MBK1810236.1 hypothetical protein [Clostridium yunnanense]
MFIRLFIKTIDNIIATETVKNVLSHIPSEFISKVDVKIEPYWKFDDVLVAELKIELSRELNDEVINDFLYSISNNWMFLGYENSEALSSHTMENCILKYSLEMIDVHFLD